MSWAQFDIIANQLLEHYHSMISEGVYDPGIFKAIIMVGPMGAGKSTVKDKLLSTMSGLRSVNLDDFNEMLVRQGKVAGGYLTPRQIESNRTLVQKRKAYFIQERLGLLIDTSGQDFNSLIDTINEAEQLGYDVLVIGVNVSLETSMARQKSRAQLQYKKWGASRNVPEDLARTSYNIIQRNIPLLQKMLGDQFILIQNDDNLNIDSAIVKRIRAFLEQEPSKPQASQWVQDELTKRKRNS